MEIATPPPKYVFEVFFPFYFILLYSIVWAICHTHCALLEILITILHSQFPGVWIFNIYNEHNLWKLLMIHKNSQCLFLTLVVSWHPCQESHTALSMWVLLQHPHSCLSFPITSHCSFPATLHMASVPIVLHSSDPSCFLSQH